MTKIKKFRKEKYIKQRMSNRTGLITFQVAFTFYDEIGEMQTYNESFAEKDYATAGEALDAACKHRDEMRHQLNTIGLIKRQEHSISDVFEDSKKLFPKSMETVRKQELTIIKFISNNVKLPIEKIKPGHIQMNLNAMIETSSNDTINRVFTIWRMLYKTALIQRYVQYDPTIEIIKPKSQQIPHKRDVVTNLKTLEKVIESLRFRTPRSDKNTFNTEIMVFALKVIYYTGMRPAECFAISRQDIDLKKKSISINKKIGSTISAKHTLRKTKTELSTRSIPMNDELVGVMKDLFAFQDNTYLFANWDGELFDINSVTNKITRCCKLAGIKFNMYMLRHLFSTDMVTTGVDMRTAMELMGHSEKGMTIYYARSNDELKKDVLEKRKMS